MSRIILTATPEHWQKAKEENREGVPLTHCCIWTQAARDQGLKIAEVRWQDEGEGEGFFYLRLEDDRCFLLSRKGKEIAKANDWALIKRQFFDLAADAEEALLNLLPATIYLEEIPTVELD